jgi:CRP/FNR family transcriptional regulator
VQTLKIGREQVTGFHMAGDVLGTDGIGSEIHGCDAIALQDSHVCAIPYSQIMKLGRSEQGLRHRIQRAMSGEIVREHGVMLLLGSMTAEERVTALTQLPRVVKFSILPRLPAPAATVPIRK